MQCDICYRSGVKDLAFYCATDARNHLYLPRLEHARILLEKDAVSQQADALIASSTSSTANDATQMTRWQIDQERASKEQSEDRTQQIIAQADILRANVQKAREEMASRKAVLARRKTDLASATKGFDKQWSLRTEETASAIKRKQYSWNKDYAKTINARATLCREAADLYGLKLRKVKRSGIAHDDYYLGGIRIMDLREMNNTPPEQISAAFSHIVQLLAVVTHYLSLRLPAEITLPHRDYPLPTIFSLQSSYTSTNVPFPSTSNTSPTASRHGDAFHGPQPRPRPLFLDKPLSILAKEDSSAYSLFVEGAMLLAHNIVWVCKTQGTSTGDGKIPTYEDMCSIGRNLYTLLVVPQDAQRPGPPTRKTSAQSTPTKGQDSDLSVTEETRKSNQGVVLGQLSHGTAHTFLSSSEGQELQRSWKLPNPLKVADQLKSQLLSELTGAEWEFLDNKSWEQEQDVEGDGVVVGGRRDKLVTGVDQSFMSVRTTLDQNVLDGSNRDRKPGTSGWTKVKNR